MPSLRLRIQRRCCGVFRRRNVEVFAKCGSLLLVHWGGPFLGGRVVVLPLVHLGFSWHGDPKRDEGSAEQPVRAAGEKNFARKKELATACKKFSAELVWQHLSERPIARRLNARKRKNRLLHSLGCAADESLL